MQINGIERARKTTGKSERRPFSRAIAPARETPAI
jgi:hypothetical protein